MTSSFHSRMVALIAIAIRSRYNDAHWPPSPKPDKDIPVAYRLMPFVVVSFLVSASLAGGADQIVEISADRIKAHVAYLSSDRLEGRGPGTRGEFLATEYIEAEFKKAGLKPIGERGTYFQK